MKRFFFLCFVLTCFHVSASEVPVALTDIDGNTFVGTLEKFDEQRIVLLEEGEMKEVAVERLVRFQSLRKNPYYSKDSPSRSFLDMTTQRRPTQKTKHNVIASLLQKSNTEKSDAEQTEQKTAFPENVSVVALKDGSSIVLTDFRSKKDSASGRMFDNRSIAFPLDAVLSVRFFASNYEEATTLPDDWRKRIQTVGRRGDSLVVGKPGALDVYEGIVMEVGPETVTFQVDGETLPVPRRKVYGLLFHAIERSPATSTDVLGTLKLWNGTAVSLRSMRFEKEDDRLSWISVSNVSSGSFLNEIDEIDFDRQSTWFLFDATPKQVEQSLLFEWEQNVSKSGSSKSDTPLNVLRDFRTKKMFAATGSEGDLPVLVPPGLGKNRDSKISDNPIPGLSGVRLDGVFYEKGLTVSPKTVLEYAVPESFTALRGTVGVDDRLRPAGQVRLLIQADDQLLFERIFRGDHSAETIGFDLPQNASVLTITVDFVPGSVESTPLSFGDLKLIK